MARRRGKGRDIQGIVLLDKALGVSSNRALQDVKRLFNAKKAGHTGSLDPMACGLLPICFGEATKVSAFLLNADKRYIATGMLGEKTRSGDTEGEVIERRDVPALDRDDMENVLQGFRGVIHQIPPMHSAIKINGQPLYKLAHKGIEIERESRTVTVFELSLLDLSLPAFTLDIRCSKGTYIRTLVEDIGEALGCGAHVKSMQRTVVGPYEIGNSITLDALRQMNEEQRQQWLMSIESALMDWPAVNLSKDTSFYLRQGQPVFVPHAPQPGWVRLYERDGGFFGMGQVLDDGRVAPKRLVNTETS